MYRAKDWRIFQLSGFGDPSDMNKRIRFLLDAGETGVIVKHDRMTDDHLYDVDHPDIVERREDVGLTGTVTVGLRDYETIMDGIPLESIYVKPGGGVPQSATGQSDFFLTYIGCPPKEQIPPGAAMRLNLDIIDWCMERMPHWVPVSIADTTVRTRGSTPGKSSGPSSPMPSNIWTRCLIEWTATTTTLLG